MTGNGVVAATICYDSLRQVTKRYHSLPYVTLYFAPRNTSYAAGTLKGMKVRHRPLPAPRPHVGESVWVRGSFGAIA